MGNTCYSKKNKIANNKSRRDFTKEEIYAENIDATAITEEAVTSHEEITKIYKFTKDLGEGHFGKVKLATLNIDPSQKFAIKVIEKSKMKKNPEFLEAELSILKELDHPNIIRFYEVYEDDKSLYLVMEHCSGGDLLEKVMKKVKLEEREVAKIMHQAFSAVVHLHKIGITHRDLKPENFLFKSEDNDSEVKLIDFGLSKYFGDKPDSKLTNAVGTPLYVAPEVLKGKYDERCDNWSLGIMMYVLLTGYPPFDGETTNDIFHKILDGSYSMQGAEWKKISSLAKDLIYKLLVLNPDQRLTASEALNHDWFKKMLNPSFICRSPKVVGILKNPKLSKKLESEILKIMIKYMPEAEIKDLKESFRFFDKDNSGYISIKELKIAMKELGQEISDSEIDQLLKCMKIGRKRKSIKFSEFIAVAMDKKYFTVERLWQIFQHLDCDKTNDIDYNDIKKVMTRAGRKCSDQEILDMIYEVDPDHDGKLTFSDFVKMMQGPNEPLKPEEIRVFAKN